MPKNHEPAGARRFAELTGHGVTVPVLEGRAGEQTPLWWPSLGEYPVYDDFLYNCMTFDEVRNEKYEQAISALARGRTVVDIGTGRDVNWARACVEAGASHVYAIEALAESYEQAKETVSSLGLEDRITLIHGLSTHVELPERVELCVSEIIGSIGGSEGAAGVLADARERFLVPYGRMVPARCETRVAAVRLPDELVADPAFHPMMVEYLQQAFDVVMHPFDIRLSVSNVGPEAIVSTDGAFEILDFESGASWEESLFELVVSRSGRVDGLLAWIRLWCSADGTPVDSLVQRSHWLPAFLPAFPPDLHLQAGDRITGSVLAQPSDDRVHPDYLVRGEIVTSDAVLPFRHHSCHHSRQFRTNPLHARLFRDSQAQI